MFKNIFYGIWGIFAFFGIFVVFIILSIVNVVKDDMKPVALPKEMVLGIDFSNNIPEHYSNEIDLDNLGKSGIYPPFTSFISGLKNAKNDASVKGIFAILEDNSLGIAQVEEIRNEIEEIKASGKKTVIFIPSMGLGLKDYYLASSFDEIWMPPNGMLPIVGVSAQVPFFKGVLEKIGVEPVVFAKHEYKGMMSSFTEKNMPLKIKENTEDMLKGMYNEIVANIAKSRNLTEKEVNDLINEAPILALKAKEKGLVDKTLYRSDAVFLAKKMFGNIGDFVDVGIYSEVVASNFDEKLPNIAVLTLSGEIQNGKVMEGFSPIIGDRNVYEEIQRIKEIENLKAVVLRIDSPGGSYDAADNIRHELSVLKQEKNIPIIASFGNVSASGGYFIAMAADKIVSDKMTITGSIGAVSAKFDLTNTLKKMGVGVETINYGKNADIFSPLSKMTKEQRDVLDGLTEHVYKDFTAKVMMSRNLNDKEIDNVARGRVFSGLDANGLKLVDEFGGILKAYEMAKKESGIAGASNLIILPRQKSPFEVFSEMFENQGFDAFLSIDSLLSILTKSNNKNKIMAKSQPVYIN